MRQKVADAAGVPLSAVSASKQAAMRRAARKAASKRAVRLLGQTPAEDEEGEAPSVRIAFEITLPDAAAADKALKAVGKRRRPCRCVELLSTDALPDVEVEMIAVSALSDAAAAVGWATPRRGPGDTAADALDQHAAHRSDERARVVGGLDGAQGEHAAAPGAAEQARSPPRTRQRPSWASAPPAARARARRARRPTRRGAPLP